MSVRSILFRAYFIILLAAVVQAQTGSQPSTLEPGKSVERTIAGGESHVYQIDLEIGQFVSAVVAQKGIDIALVLTAPDGRELVEVNLSPGVGLESLSAEAASGGNYRLTVRAPGNAAQTGEYQVRFGVKLSVGAEDQRRIAAEAALRDAAELRKQGPNGADQMIDKLQQALTVWREIDDRYWSGWILFNIGSAHLSVSRSDKAIEYFEQALVIYRDLKDRAIEGRALNDLGVVYLNLSRYEKAIEYFDQALAIRREMKDRAGEGLSFINLGITYRNLGRYEKAIEYFERSLAISREVKDRAAEGSSLSNLGIAFRSLGRYEKAAEYLEQALAMRREARDRAREGASLNSLGAVYYMMGRYDKAAEYYEQALAIMREVKNRSGEGSLLNNLGNVYRSLGRYEKAIEYQEQALAISREVKDRAGEGFTLNNLGNSYNSLGRYDKAVEYYEEALTIRREVKDRAGEGGSLNNLGTAYKDSGRYEKAIEYFEQALTIHREVKDRAGEGSLLNNLGNVYYRLGRYEKAIEYSEQSLAIHREVKNRADEGRPLNNLGNVYHRLGRYEKAIESHEQALAISREVKDRTSEALALKDLAHAESARGNLAAARTHVEEGLKVSEAIRAEVISPESRASFLAGTQSAYQLYTDVLMRQHRAEPAKGLDALALETSERQRARSLLDLLTEARADLHKGVDAALIERERSLAKQLSDKARTQTKTPEQAAALKREISQLENDHERAQTAIRKASPRYASLVQPQLPKLNEIQLQLDGDTVLLEYALGPERSYLWAITNDSLTSYELPKVEVIEKSAREVYELLTARSTNKKGETASQRRQRISQAEAKLPVAASELSKTILAPVAAQLGKKRLVIVADGALQYVPFAMLPDPRSLADPAATAKPGDQKPKTEGQPLIVNHEVVSLPSASTLLFQRKELDGRQPAPKTLAVIADPVFDRTDDRFKTNVSEDEAVRQTAKPDDTRGLEHIVDESTTSGRLVIRRLPFTRQEADTITALTPKNSSFKAIDFQANRTNVLNGDLSQYKYVHFATHGVMDAQRPGLSSLVLSTVDAAGKPQNGFLRANDIYNMKLPAELVVLSACQTGLGKEVKGEGLIGLTRGFMYAGAKRVVVSLWSVNDRATADLMTDFYRGMLKDNERPAAALRTAQIEMWKQKKWQSPYYWAAFTIQGEWK